jgi:hypothetical protein
VYTISYFIQRRMRGTFPVIIYCAYENILFASRIHPMCRTLLKLEEEK